MILVRQEKIALVLALVVIAAVAISTFVLESAGKGAFARPLSPDSREGELVFFEGSVEEVRTTATGGHQILRVSGVRVFVPSTSVHKGWPGVGDEIRVFGTVQTFRGEREVLVRSAEDIMPVSSSPKKR